MRTKFILILAFLPICAMSQSYTLDDCCRMALENNRTLTSTRIDVEKAVEDERESFTAYFPEISATGAVFQGAHHLIQEMSLVKKGAIASVSAIQPVFAGGKIVNKNKLAKIQQEVSKLQYELTEKEIIQRCSEMYWLIVSLRANIATLDAADRHLAEMMRQTKDNVEAGVRLPADTMRIKLKQSELKSSRLSIDNALNLNMMSLANLIGAEWNGFAIADMAFSMPASPVSSYISPDDAVSNRREYALSQKQLEASRYQLRMEQGKLLPSLGIGVTGMYANLMEKGETNMLVFASLSIPISAWWGGSHAVKKARLNRRQAEIAMEDIRSDLRIDIQHAWDNTIEAYQQILIAHDALRVAEENLRMNGDYYESGTINISDFLDAENMFIQNSNNLTTAYATYQIRLADYRRKVE